MPRTSALISENTVPTRLTLVNSVGPVDTENHDAPGQRLRAFIDQRWGRKQGGIRGLARELNTSTETIYEWFRGEREPNLDHVARLSKALGVGRYEIVAAMDGEGPVVKVDTQLRDLIRDEVEAVLDERQGGRGNGSSSAA